MKFTRKGFGRIYVEYESDVVRVENIIKEISSFEFEYLPPYFVTAFFSFPKLVYTHKFDDIDINYLTAYCWSRGIKIFCLDNGHDEFFDYQEKVVE